jgi:hypothetical protein
MGAAAIIADGMALPSDSMIDSRLESAASFRDFSRASLANFSNYFSNCLSRS